MEIPIVGSIDSFLMAAAMALAGCPQTWRRQAIWWFMAFDFVGTSTSWSFGISHGAAFALVSALAFLILYAARKRAVLFLLLPLIGSADNLLIGGEGPMRFSAAAGAAISTGILALIGFSLGSVLSRRMQGATQ